MIAYGAQGDGKADDTKALQAALDSRFARIYVPAGVFKISDALRIGSGKCLTLSPDATILRGSNSSAMLLNATDGTRGGYDASADIVVEGGTWDGNSAKFTEACTLLGFGHASDIIVRSCTVRNIPQWHGIELNATRRAVVERVRFENCQNEALQLDTMNSAGGPAVFPWFGPYDDTICRDVEIRDCVFERVVTAVGSHSAPPIDGLRILRCLIQNTTGIAIKPGGYRNMVVEDCVFVHCQSVFAGNVVGFALRRNQIVGSTQSDISVAMARDGAIERTTFAGPSFGITDLSATVTVSDTRYLAEPGSAPPELQIAEPAAAFDSSTAGSAPIAVVPIKVGPADVSGGAEVGDDLWLSVDTTVTSLALYQWMKDGSAIAGATSPVFTIRQARWRDAGSYQVAISNAGGRVVSGPARVAIAPRRNPAMPPAFANLAARSRLGSSYNGVLTAGFIMEGEGDRSLLVRGIGPSLRAFGVADAVDQVELSVFDRNGSMLNDVTSWDIGLLPAFSKVGAFALSPGSRDAAVLVEGSAAAVTAQLSSATGGAALLELFAAKPETAASARLVALAARGTAGAGEALAAGFTVTGAGLHRLLIRAIGPGLAPFGIRDRLNRPRIEVFDADGAKCGEAEQWDPALAGVFERVHAFPLAPGSDDAAMLLEVVGGTSHTILVRGTMPPAEVLVEIYLVD